MDAEKKRALKIKRKAKKKKPEFLRQEYFKHARLEEKWRRPKGKHSKLRKHEKSRGSLPNPGYRSPKLVRGLNKLGFREVVINNPKELEKLNKDEDMAVIGSSVGKKKRLEILKKAEELGIRVANPRINL